MSSPPSDTFPEKLSNLLQAAWDSEATGLQVTDVSWSHDRYETMTNVEQTSQKAIVSMYNPNNPRTCEVLSAQTNFIHEIVLIDIVLHTAPLGGTDQALKTREAIVSLILTIVHGIQRDTGAFLVGANSIQVNGEYVRVEGPEKQRVTLKVTISWFEVLPL
jgi:hypothetical protein